MAVSKTVEMTRKLMEPFPVDVIDEKQGLLYIPHEIIRERLISATDNRFDWSVDQVLFRDDDVARSKGAHPTVMIVIGTLTIPDLGSRAGIGAHPLHEGSGEDAAYKSAESDALKRAAMAFGVGLHQLYIETGEVKRSQKPTRRAPARSQAQPERPPMNDLQFAGEVRKAMSARDAGAFRKLVDEADSQTGRWIALVQAAESPQALDWIKRQIERKGIGNDLLDHEIRKREEQVTANPSEAVEPPSAPIEKPGADHLLVLRSLATDLGLTDGEMREAIGDTATFSREKAEELVKSWRLKLEQKKAERPLSNDHGRPFTQGQIRQIESLGKQLDMTDDDLARDVAAVQTADDAKDLIALYTDRLATYAAAPAETT